jgi:hypothetical protein
MASSKKKTSSRPKPKAKSRAKPKAEMREQVDTGLRQPISKGNVISLAAWQKRCLARSAEAGQEFSTEMKKALERGLNPVAFRLATRLTRMAERDPAKALVCREDLDYYLECLDFDKMTSKSMFPASEVRSSKKSRKKPEPEQADLSDRGDLNGQGDNVAHLDDHREAAETEETAAA